MNWVLKASEGHFPCDGCGEQLTTAKEHRAHCRVCGELKLVKQGLLFPFHKREDNNTIESKQTNQEEVTEKKSSIQKPSTNKIKTKPARCSPQMNSSTPKLSQTKFTTHTSSPQKDQPTKTNIQKKHLQTKSTETKGPLKNYPVSQQEPPLKNSPSKNSLPRNSPQSTQPRASLQIKLGKTIRNKCAQTKNACNEIQKDVMEDQDLESDVSKHRVQESKAVQYKVNKAPQIKSIPIKSRSNGSDSKAKTSSLPLPQTTKTPASHNEESEVSTDSSRQSHQKSKSKSKTQNIQPKVSPYSEPNTKTQPVLPIRLQITNPAHSNTDSLPTITARGPSADSYQNHPPRSFERQNTANETGVTPQDVHWEKKEISDGSQNSSEDESMDEEEDDEYVPSIPTVQKSAVDVQLMSGIAPIGFRTRRKLAASEEKTCNPSVYKKYTQSNGSITPISKRTRRNQTVVDPIQIKEETEHKTVQKNRKYKQSSVGENEELFTISLGSNSSDPESSEDPLEQISNSTDDKEEEDNDKKDKKDEGDKEDKKDKEEKEDGRMRTDSNPARCSSPLNLQTTESAHPYFLRSYTVFTKTERTNFCLEPPQNPTDSHNSNGYLLSQSSAPENGSTLTQSVPSLTFTFSAKMKKNCTTTTSDIKSSVNQDEENFQREVDSSTLPILPCLSSSNTSPLQMTSGPKTRKSPKSKSVTSLVLPPKTTKQNPPLNSDPSPVKATSPLLMSPLSKTNATTTTSGQSIRLTPKKTVSSSLPIESSPSSTMTPTKSLSLKLPLLSTAPNVATKEEKLENLRTSFDVSEEDNAYSEISEDESVGRNTEIIGNEFSRGSDYEKDENSEEDVVSGDNLSLDATNGDSDLEVDVGDIPPHRYICAGCVEMTLYRPSP